MAAVKPGVAYRDFHVAAMTVLAHGLADMGMLPCSADEALEKDNGVYRRWTLHGTGHMLGLDVHDCAAARERELPRRQARARHGAHRRAGALLPVRATCSCPSRCAASASGSRTTSSSPTTAAQPVRRHCREPPTTSRRGWPGSRPDQRSISRGSFMKRTVVASVIAAVVATGLAQPSSPPDPSWTPLETLGGSARSAVLDDGTVVVVSTGGADQATVFEYRILPRQR